jgi:hypothetical protein
LAAETYRIYFRTWMSSQLRALLNLFLTTDCATEEGADEALEKEAIEQICSEKLKTL